MKEKVITATTLSPGVALVKQDKICHFEGRGRRRVGEGEGKEGGGAKNINWIQAFLPPFLYKGVWQFPSHAISINNGTTLAVITCCLLKGSSRGNRYGAPRVSSKYSIIDTLVKKKREESKTLISQTISFPYGGY